MGRAVESSSGRIGDLLVVFGDATPGSESRFPTCPWKLDQKAATWSMLLQPSREAWKGIPLRTILAPGWRIWLLGELFTAPNGALPTDDFVLGVAAGRLPATEMNGHMLLLAWDEEARQWHVRTNRFGTMHAYYATDGRRAAIGTFFPAVAHAASRRRLDWPALTAFFSSSFFPQDRTFFDDVRILRPATHYVWDSDGALHSQNRYWTWSHAPNRARSYDDTVDEFGRVFRTVMADMTAEGRMALPISGGLDSRTIAGFFGGKDGAPSDRLWTYSYGYSPRSPETNIASQIATRRALPFQSYTVGPYLFDRLEQVEASVEGFQDVTQCRQASVLDELGSRADYVLGGHLGDLILDSIGLWPPPQADQSGSAALEMALHKVRKRGRDWLVSNICRRHLGDEEPESLQRAMTTEEMQPLAHIEDPDFRVKAFKMDQYCFRWTAASFRMFQPAAFPRLPFYDNRIMDLVCTMPTEYVAGRRLQIDYLKRFAPDLARVPWQKYDADLFTYQRFGTWHLPRRACKKAWRVLTRQRVLERNWEAQFLSDRGREGLTRWLLHPGLRLHDLVSAREVAALLDAFYASPNAGSGYTVSMLLTFSAWLERYG